MTFETTSSSKQLAREAKLGLTVVAVLLMLFVYVAVKRIGGGFDRQPKHYVGLDDQLVEPLISDYDDLENDQDAQANDNLRNQVSDASGSKESTAASGEVGSDLYPQLPPNAPVGNEQRFDPAALDELPATPPVVVESGINLLSESGTESVSPPSSVGESNRTRQFDRQKFQNLKAPSDPPPNAIALAGATEDSGTQFDPNAFLPGGSNADLTGDGSSNLNSTPKKLLRNDLRSPVREDKQSLPVPRSKSKSEDSTNEFPVPDVSTIDDLKSDLPPPNVEVEQVAKPKPPYKHQVAGAESYWSICSEAYGDGQWFRVLHHHNMQKYGVDPIAKVGSVDVPSLADLKKKYPKLAAEVTGANQPQGELFKGKTKVYKTTAGETLFSIAAEQLGQASRFNTLLQLNRDILPKDANHLTRLKPGTRIIIPAQ